jgi:hypothetical protein
MNKIWNSLLVISAVVFIGGFTYWALPNFSISGAPPYGEDENDVPEGNFLTGWKRPEGEAKVALQVGHWKNNELPEELAKLRGNTGSSGGGKSEGEVNLRIAEETKKLLEAKGIKVELLPATVPENYWADVFVSVHADGSLDSNTSGFKVAGPWRDRTGKTGQLVAEIEKEYQTTTNLEKDPNISRNMRGYYAFSSWRYDHAVHPMTTAVIVETGFLTSPSDREVIVNSPEKSASGISKAILNHLTKEKLI